VSTSTVTVYPTATTLVAENFRRVGLELENQDTVVISISDKSTMVSTEGITLQVGERRTETPDSEKGAFFYKGAVYGAVASGTALCRVVEWETTR